MLVDETQAVSDIVAKAASHIAASRAAFAALRDEHHGASSSVRLGAVPLITHSVLRLAAQRTSGCALS